VLGLEELLQEVDPLLDHVVDDGFSELGVEDVVDLVEETLEVTTSVVVGVCREELEDLLFFGFVHFF
jgi:hypothetical protein